MNKKTKIIFAKKKTQRTKQEEGLTRMVFGIKYKKEIPNEK